MRPVQHFSRSIQWNCSHTSAILGIRSVATATPKERRRAVPRPSQQIPSVDRFFISSMSPLEVGTLVGCGGTSRADPGSERKELTKFFQRGNAKKHLRDGVARPQKVKDVADSDSAERSFGANHPVHEMQFFNIGGARIYTYYGLETIRKRLDILKAGAHSTDTAIGVLMLDEYAIQERPGDPANPFTWWPYRVFYAVPLGIDFAECKRVGSLGVNAAKEAPLLVGAICQALMGLAEAAAKMGYTRLMITGDCGYFALATEAYSKQLCAWGEKSWSPHPEGAFAAFRVPRFYCPSQKLEIVLALGTTQLISTPDVHHNLCAQVDGASVVYTTADLRGWYGNPFLRGEKPGEPTALEKEYAPFLEKAGKHDISGFDVVDRVNDGLLIGISAFKDERFFNEQLYDEQLRAAAEKLVEFNAGSTPYMLGVYLGYSTVKYRPADDARGIQEYIFECACQQRDLVEKLCSNPKNTDFKNFFRTFALHVTNAFRAKHNKPKLRSLDGEELWRALIAIVGNEEGTKTFEELVDLTADKVKEVARALLLVTERFAERVKGIPNNTDLAVGKQFVECYTRFNLHLNQNLLGDVDVVKGHAVDGKDVILFDARYIPGFGQAVGGGNTVWQQTKNYVWMSEMLLRFCELLQAHQSDCLFLAQECTELFGFTPFIQQFGVPVLDNVNLLAIASRTKHPIRWVNFNQDADGSPPSPRALLMYADEEPDGTTVSKVYRDRRLLVRTPTDCNKEYERSAANFASILRDQQQRWTALTMALPRFGQDEFTWSHHDYQESKPGETMYVASSQLDRLSYLPEESHEKPMMLGAVQLKFRDGEKAEHDKMSFFGEQ